MLKSSNMPFSPLPRFSGKMEDVCFHEVAAIKSVYSKEGRPVPDVTAFVAIRNHQTRFWDPCSQDSKANLGSSLFISDGSDKFRDRLSPGCLMP